MKRKNLLHFSIALVTFMAIASAAVAYEVHKGPTGVIYYDKAKTFNGYTLFSPTEVNNVIYLINMEGDVVHTWEVKAEPKSEFMNAQLLPNGNVLVLYQIGKRPVSIGGSSGMVEELDWNSNVVWSYKMANETELSHHTVDRMPNGNTLILGWEHISNERMIEKGRDPKTIAPKPVMIGGMPTTDFWVDFVREVDQKGNTVWEWHLIDHTGTGPDKLDPNYILPRKVGAGYDGADWSHFNTLEYVPEKDQILMNSRNFSELLLVDRKTGKIVTRWGNPSSHGKGEKPIWYDDRDQVMFGSHHASMIGPDKVSVFDNGSERAEVNRSRVLEVDLKTGKIEWEYAANGSNSFFSFRQGAAQLLPNGSYLVTSTQHGHVFEVTRDKKIVWEFVNPIMRGKSSPIFSDEDHVRRKPDGTPLPHMFHNMIHRAYRYAPDYPGLKGKDLTPKGYIVEGGQKIFKLFQ